jgi:hypothetical protein
MGWTEVTTEVRTLSKPWTTETMVLDRSFPYM